MFQEALNNTYHLAVQKPCAYCAQRLVFCALINPVKAAANEVYFAVFMK